MNALSPTAKLLLVTILSFVTGAGVVWVMLTAEVRKPKSIPATAASDPVKAEVVVPASVPFPTVPRLQPDDEEIPQITDALRASFAGASDLVGVELSPAAVRALFEKPETQVRLLAAPEPAVEETKPQIKLLPRRVIYWRPGALVPQNLDAFAAAWPVLLKEKPLGLVLDLRQVSASAGYEGAADLLSFFASPESTLFTIQELKTAQRVFRAGRQPLNIPLGFPIVVLVHGRTLGAPEIVAQWLAARRGALLLGTPTAGQGWPFLDVPLKSGRVLRLPVARVVSPTGQDLGKGPIEPDVMVVVDPVEEAAALAFVSAGRVEESVAEVPSRRQQNEASLLREENPELDELIENQNRTSTAGPPPPRDVALQRALDVVEAIATMYAGLTPRSTPTPLPKTQP